MSARRKDATAPSAPAWAHPVRARTQLEILAEADAVTYAACGGLWIMLMHRPPGVDDMTAAVPTLQRMATLAPEGFGTLTWVLPAAGFSMDGATRTTAAEIAKTYDRLIRAQATLIEGQGFQAASVRMIITGLDLLSRPSSPTRVLSHLRDAVAWAVPFSAANPNVDDVVHELERLRDTLTDDQVR